MVATPPTSPLLHLYHQRGPWTGSIRHFPAACLSPSCPTETLMSYLQGSQRAPGRLGRSGRHFLQCVLMKDALLSSLPSITSFPSLTLSPLLQEASTAEWRLNASLPPGEDSAGENQRPDSVTSPSIDRE